MATKNDGLLNHTIALAKPLKWMRLRGRGKIEGVKEGERDEVRVREEVVPV
jgi:hypothetical protein